MAEITLAGFELIEQLGQGAMGVVWKARQLSLDRLVAIKVIPPEVIRSPEDVRMILQEARAAARLKHSGIVQIYDACEQNGTYFLVMEYVEGYNLGQWQARRKHLGVKDVLLIAEAVAVALDHAWQATGLIHCDIKPENIMVDQDGAIKVADLGLSRTRDAKEPGAADEVMGTPAYMAPEQIRGGVTLDCRTDIYSLGATMYQLLTGKRPFSEKSDSDAMESQLTEQIADPREIVPGIPGCVCSLLERMMVKDREGRPADWSKVLADLRRVSKGLMPLTPAPAAGASTIRCRRNVVVKGEAGAVTTEKPKRRGVWRLLWLAALLIAAVAVFWMRAWSRSTRPRTEESGSRVPAIFRAEPDPERAAESLRMLEEALRFSRANSRSYDAAVARYRAVVERYPDSKAARQALDEIRKLSARQSGEMENAWKAIALRADQLVRERRLEEALRFVENYSGAWAAETASNRMELARGLRRQKVEGEMARIEDEQWRQFLDKTADWILAGRFRDAQDGLLAALKAGTYPRQKDAMEGVNAMLQESLDASARIRQSFEADVGRVLRMPMGRTQMPMRIIGISGQKIAAILVEGGAQVLIHPDDLPAEERLKRMGDPASPGLALAKGVLAAGTRQFAVAEDMFGRTGPVLSGVLVEKLRLARAGMGAEQVTAALAGVLGSGGIAVGPYSEEDWVKALEQARPSRDRLQKLMEQRDEFLAKYGASESALRMAPVLLVLERQCQLWSGRKDLAQETVPATPGTGGPADTSLRGITRRFLERNPGIQERHVSPYPAHGGGGLRVVSDSVVELAPLGEGDGIKGLWLETKGAVDLKLDLLPLARSGLSELRLKGYLPRDANVLHGMALKHLTLTGINLPSYSWLEGLPLVELDLTGAGIRELSPLRGMKLEKLTLNGTQLNGVAPLAGMPLRELNCGGTLVRDITVLRGLPLTCLDLSQTPVADCSVLRGMNLVSLDLSGTGVRDISMCGAMPLERLAVAGTRVEDISCLRGKNLKRLILARTAVTDISALAGSSIGTLDLSGTRVPPVNLLRTIPKMRIQELALEDMDVARLDCLKGQSLTRLSLKGTKVADIAPLSGMPLKILDLRGLRLLDVGVLDSLPDLEQVWCEMDPLQVKVLFDRHPKVQRINGEPRPGAVRL